MHRRLVVSFLVLAVGILIAGITRADSLPGVRFYSGLQPFSGDLPSALSEEYGFLVVEGRDVAIPQSLGVNTSQPGFYDDFGFLATFQENLASRFPNARLNSYLISFHHEAPENVNRLKHSATIAFVNPIAAVISGTTNLDLTPGALLDPASNYAQGASRGLELAILPPNPNRDSFRFGSSSLTVAAATAGQADEIRILTFSGQPAPARPLMKLALPPGSVELRPPTGSGQPLELERLEFDEVAPVFEPVLQKVHLGFGSGVIGAARISGAAYQVQAPLGYSLTYDMPPGATDLMQELLAEPGDVVPTAGRLFLVPEGEGPTFEVEITNSTFLSLLGDLQIPAAGMEPSTLRLTEGTLSTAPFGFTPAVSGLQLVNVDPITLGGRIIPEPGTVVLALCVASWLWLRPR